MWNCLFVSSLFPLPDINSHPFCRRFVEIVFYLWRTLYCIHIPHFLYSAICFWTSMLIRNLHCSDLNCSQHGRVGISFTGEVISFGYSPRTKIAGFYSRDAFSVLRNLPALFPDGGNLPWNQRCNRFRFCLHSNVLFLTLSS